MAEISTNSNEARGSRYRIRPNIKIDMTPMVDLAFLLLTFFILTTSFNDLKILELPMPDKGEPQEISANNIINVVLAENKKVYWWVGLDGKVYQTNYSNNGLRKLLIEQTKANPKLMILVKPKDQAKYENVVDILDEIRIVGASRYAIVDFTADDNEKLIGIVTN